MLAADKTEKTPISPVRRFADGRGLKEWGGMGKGKRDLTKKDTGERRR